MTMCLIYIYKNLYVQYIILIILNTNLTKSHINHKSNANRKPPRLWAKCPAYIYTKCRFNVMFVDRASYRNCIEITRQIIL